MSAGKNEPVEAAGIRVKVSTDGPYLVSGGAPLIEMAIVNDEQGVPYAWKKGKRYPAREACALCRCGRSAKKPFCDGTHIKVKFDGTEALSRPFGKGAEVFEGPSLKLIDDRAFCARARYCHRGEGIWKLTEHSHDPKARRQAIEISGNCPAGRLVLKDQGTGKEIEPELEEAIGLVEDPHRQEEGPLWVMGGIQIEGAGGFLYQRRNRVTLCRCGRSGNKPFCDGSHSD